MQGSPSDKDIIDLFGHYGLGVMAVNAAMQRIYDFHNAKLLYFCGIDASSERLAERQGHN